MNKFTKNHHKVNFISLTLDKKEDLYKTTSTKESSIYFETIEPK